MDTRIEERLDKRISELEKLYIGNDILLKQFMEITKELSSTIRNIEKTMISMQMILQATNKDTTSLNKKIEKLDNKVNDESDANKIDIRATLTNSITEVLNLVWKGVIGIGAFVGFYEMFKEPIEKVMGD